MWVQGCTLGCPGCFNPGTHAPSGGQAVAIPALVDQIVTGPAIQGVTISGGEPLQQLPALLALLHELRARTFLSVLLFSGFTWDEIQRMPSAADLLAHLDVLIAGRYQAGLRQAYGLIGSTNKTLHFLTPRYTAADLQAVPPAEILLGPDGEIRLSGIDPLQWE
ncbi:MAG: radical SAM protein [Chloroflexi bacterium]|nr:radical SAM protein [Chloroflexota bacterium]